MLDWGELSSVCAFKFASVWGALLGVCVCDIAARITACRVKRCCSLSDPTEALNASAHDLARWVRDLPQARAEGGVQSTVPSVE